MQIVIVANFPSSDLKYVALGYVWGKNQVCKMLEADQDRWEIGVALDTLPKTIQDAAVVASRLGYSYLWVDAL